MDGPYDHVPAVDRDVVAQLRRVEQHLARVLAEEKADEDSPTVRIIAVGMLARSHSAVRAILLLHENQLPFDMVAVGRLLHEAAIVSTWINRKDNVERAERFFMSGVLRTDAHINITEKAHGVGLRGPVAVMHRLSLEAVAQRFPETVFAEKGSGKKRGPPELVPDLLSMAREDADVLHFYNFGFAVHSIHAHCDPRSISMAARPDMESTARSGLQGALIATILITTACGRLLGRTDHAPLVDELVPFVYQITGAKLPGSGA